MRGPAWAAAALMLAVAALYAAIGSAPAATSPASSHPSSVLPYGTSLFYSDLRRWWEASQGGVVEGLGADAYLVIAPDVPFTQREVEALGERLARGGFGLLIADETRVGAALARSLADVEIYHGYVYNAKVPPGNPAIETVRAECMGRTLLTTRASFIESYPEWMEPVCWLVDVYAPYTKEGRMDRAVLAVYGEANGSRVLVIADSTIFTNLFYRGAFGTPPTRDAALSLVELVAPRGSRVVYDTEHLARGELDPLLSAAALAVEAPAAAANAAMSVPHGPLAGAAALAASIGGLLVLHGLPAVPKRPRGRPAPRGALIYLARECSALGAGAACPPWLLGGGAGDVTEDDVEWVAGRLLEVVVRRGG